MGPRGRRFCSWPLCGHWIGQIGGRCVTIAPMPDRLFQAAAFVTALQAASRKNPRSWRSVASIGRDAGIEDPAELTQAVRATPPTTG